MFRYSMFSVEVRVGKTDVFGNNDTDTNVCFPNVLLRTKTISETLLKPSSGKRGLF